MAFADGIAVEIGMVPETTLNVTPASPTLKRYRFISRNVNLQKNILESAEVSAHAQVAENRHGFNRVEGTVTGELLTGGFDPLLASACDGVWSSAVGVSAITAAVTAPGTVTMTTTGLQAGDFILLAGFANARNNGVFQVTAISSGSALTVAVPSALPLVTQTGGTGSMLGRRLLMKRPVLSTFTMERAYPDIDQFEVFTGVTMNGFSISVTPDAVVTVSFPTLGMQSHGYTNASLDAAYDTNYAAGDSGYAAPASGSPYDAFTGFITEGTGVVGAVTSLEMTVAANKSLQAVVGSKFSPSIFKARRSISGTMSVMFQDAVIANKFVNETTTKLGFSLPDPNGVDYMGFYMPRVKINSFTVDPGQSGPVIAQCAFVALYDATALTSLAITRSNAA